MSHDREALKTHYDDDQGVTSMLPAIGRVGLLVLTLG